MILNKKPFLVLWALLLLITSVYAQEKLLDNKISVNYCQVRLVDLLHDLENKHGFEFAYATDQLPLDKQVTLFIKNKKAIEVLDLLLEDLELKYHFVNNKIVLKRKQHVSIKKYQQTASIAGFIKEKGSLEILPGATVYIPALRQGVVANNYGFYSMTVPIGDYEIEFSFVGFTKSVQKLSVDGLKKLDVELEAANMLKEVPVVGNKESQRITETTQMSSVSVPISQSQSIPALLCEKDIFKVFQLFPGVQKGMEENSGFYVRGGTPDQNLVILDDAVVYNANHLMGFFSIFNGDALKSVELIKGGFPARFGERLSSVTIVNMKDGNKEKFHGEAGISLLSSRLTLEGPIKKGKSSFLVSGRRTYLDLLLLPFQEDDNKVGLYFFDLNTKYSAYIDNENRLYLSGYFGRDKFYTTATSTDGVNKSSTSWGNATLTARWNHIFGHKLFSNTSLIYSNYDFGYKNEMNESLHFQNKSSITDIGGKFDLDYSVDHSHFFRMGIRSVVHQFKPQGVHSEIYNYNTLKEEKYISSENNLFVEDNWKISDQLNVNVGFRTSSFVTKVQIYWNIEPRLAAKWALNNDLAINASYARMNQYIHLIPMMSSIDGLPLDLWLPSTETIRPQRSDQIALGLVKDLDNNFTLSLEGYYKKMNHILAYKEGHSFIDVVNDLSGWQELVTAGQGKGYGAELLLQRKVGKLSGWLGYTLSWIKYQFDELNFGKEFYPRQDRRHDISLVGVYQPSAKMKLSFTWVYSSGAPYQLARAQYAVRVDGPPDIYSSVSSQTAVDYGDKDSYRTDAYHRLNLGVQFIKKKKYGDRIWEVSAYNVYNKFNPFYYDRNTIPFASDPDKEETGLKKFSLFPIIPSVTYIRKF